MTVTVVLSTYRQPEWLRKVFWGYREQTFEDFELVVADDGSGAETEAVIGEARRESRVPIRHVWHEDRGWRKCRILNRAVAAARGDYLVFSDGDLIPRRDFVETHVRLSAERRFLSGGAVRLPMEVSRAIDREDVRSGRFADPAWIRSRGHRLGRHALRLLEGPLPALLDRLTPTRPTWNGGNASVARDAVLAVNGFEAELGYGGEDREFGQRLENLGLKGRQVRYRAVLLHLEHERPYVSDEVLERNRRLRERLRDSGEVRARSGIGEAREDESAPGGER